MRWKNKCRKKNQTLGLDLSTQVIHIQDINLFGWSMHCGVHIRVSLRIGTSFINDS